MENGDSLQFPTKNIFLITVMVCQELQDFLVGEGKGGCKGKKEISSKASSNITVQTINKASTEGRCAGWSVVMELGGDRSRRVSRQE